MVKFECTNPSCSDKEQKNPPIPIIKNFESSGSIAKRDLIGYKCTTCGSPVNATKIN